MRLDDPIPSLERRSVHMYLDIYFALLEIHFALLGEKWGHLRQEVFYYLYKHSDGKSCVITAPIMQRNV